MSSLSSAAQLPLANGLRILAMDAVERSRSGHPGMPMGMADVATVLFTQFLKFDAASPDWADRDRFVLSAGHGSMLLYGLLHLTGYDSMTMEQIRNFRQLNSITPGHPEFGHTPGVECTTGPLGQGLAMAVGMALGERILNAEFGDSLVDHRTYVIAGDGCLMEGVSHEAISLAGHLGLSKLIVLWDDNQISIDGATSLSVSDDQIARFKASQWNAERIDGHNPTEIAAALTRAQSSNRPSLIACRTIIGKGSPNKGGTSATHGSPLGADEAAAVRQSLGWTAPPFEIPADILSVWREAGRRGSVQRNKWEEQLASADSTTRQNWKARHEAGVPTAVTAAINDYRQKLLESKPTEASRVSSQKALEVIAPQWAALVGGSADLTGSNNTKVAGQKTIAKGGYGGNYLYYGVREFGMAAAMNGLALHGGVVPYGGTFLVFSDYCRPAIRLAALMRLRVIFVLTHDSIGLGEDGPTHQPVEHLAALRAIPNLLVFRPADAEETLSAWEVALSQTETPTVLALSRQNLTFLPRITAAQNGTAKNGTDLGGYVVTEAKGGKRDLTLMASGSEVELAVKAQAELARVGIAAAVVSIPSFERFRAQSAEYRQAVLGSAPRIAIEAAIEQGWQEWEITEFIGMKGFGASAPAGDLFKFFGITVEAIVAAGQKLAKK
ncbi:MAG: transketolase [Candidatus Pacebacteria bacterium]|nr:transketolase [Candidatus Paceibacterota bacterium]